MWRPQKQQATGGGLNACGRSFGGGREGGCLGPSRGRDGACLVVAAVSLEGARVSWSVLGQAEARQVGFSFAFDVEVV